MRHLHKINSYTRINVLALVFLIFIILQMQAAFGQAASCPGFLIEGFGKDTTGGCGGQVINITNLNDSGAGSLRACLEASGPRICRPTVSGWVNVNEEIEILNGNLTLDGSAAPGGGFGVKFSKSGLKQGQSGAVLIRTSNVIFRYVRFRAGACSSDDSCEYDSLSINGLPGSTPIQNIVLDHISTGWADDGTLDIVGFTRNVTVQWSIIHDSLGENGCMIVGSPSDTSQITMHHNIFYQCKVRAPEQQVGQVDFRNNVIYRNDNRNRDSFRDVTQVSTKFPGTPAQTNLVNNYYKAGPNEGIDYRLDPIMLADQESTSATLAGAGAYLIGNKMDTLNGIQDATYERDSGFPAPRSTPFSFPAVTTTSAAQAYNDVLASAGATLPCRDSVDRDVVAYMQNRTGPMLARGGSLTWPNLNQACSGGTSQLPSVSISASPASITSGSSSTLTWSSTNANSCTATGGWTGAKTASGSQSVTPTSTTTYTLTCTGSGGSGSQSTTVTVAVTDTTPPIVSLTSPSSGAIVSGTTTISVTATDNVGVSKVEFYVDNTLKGTDTSSPYSYSWDTTNGGTHACLGAHTHTLSAKAYDAANNIGTSSAIVVNMNNPDYCTTTPPPSLPSGMRAYSTYNSIGIEWDISTDSNHNARVAVQYRVKGFGVWQQALDLLRVDYDARGNHYSEAALYPVDRAYNMHAGSIFFLTPGVTYEVQLSRTDPDGGAASYIIEVSTQPMPTLPVGRTLHAIPGTSGGDGSSANPYRGMATAWANAQPGDTILLHTGNYGFVRDTNGVSGSPGRHIVFKPAGDGAVTLNALELMTRSYIWIEGINFVNSGSSDTGLYSSLLYSGYDQGFVPMNTDVNGVVVTRNTFSGYKHSIRLGPRTSGWYVADNTITGNVVLSTSVSAVDGEGIEAGHGSNHVIAHNRISFVADGISFCNRNCDIFGNDIFSVSDDGVETDHGYANIRVWGNRITNVDAHIFSFQPMDSGSWYFIRNQAVLGNPGREGAFFKFRTQHRFVLIGNTFVGWAANGESPSRDMHYILNTISRNNLYINAGGSGPLWDGSVSCTDSSQCSPAEFQPSWKTDMDRDGFDWGSASTAFRWGGSSYATLTAFANAIGIERNAIRVDKNSIFSTFNVPSSPGTVSPQHFTLRAGSNAVDAGVAVPNINDIYSGAAPDLGAHELGAALAQYGPRSYDETDTTAPVISNGLPSGTLIAGTTSTTLSLTTNEAATCRYSTAANTAYSSKTGTFTTTGSTSHSRSLTGLANGQTYNYYVRCIDAAGNANTNDLLITFSVSAADTTPPVISSVASSSITSSSATISWTTNENADTQVDYGTTTSYGSSTTLNTALATSHSQSLSGLQANTLYHYRAKSRDAAGLIANSQDFTFTTLPSATTTSNGDVNGDNKVDMNDVLFITNDFGKTSGYDPRADVAAPFGVINLYDIMAVVMNWGKDYGSIPLNSFPVSLLGTTLPEEATVSLSVSKPSNAIDAALTMSVYDPDFADEGELYINGNGPVQLFGTQIGPDVSTINTVFTTPASWWANWANSLRFSHLSTGGFTVNSASVSFSTATSQPTVTIYVNPSSITSGGSSTLTWSSTNANSCTASGGSAEWAGTKTTSGSQSVTPSSTTTYTLTCTGTGGSSSQSATVTVATADTTPPARSNGVPSGTLAAGTTSSTLSLTTNEAATCRYSTTANTAYSSKTGTFTTTGGTSHSTTISGLANGQSYNYYIRCTDTAGNANTNDFTVSFSVATQGTAACTHYASPSGGGNGLSQSSPFQIANFWSVAGPGKTLCLLDGTYTGSASMIQPTGLSGTAASPITIRAINEGNVLIDGQDSRRPLQGIGNYFVVEGINFARGDNANVALRGNNWILRRIISWNGGTDSDAIFDVAGQNNLIEDCAAFGAGRKPIAAGAAGANGAGLNNVVRRCWARWESNTKMDSDPTYTYEVGYYQNNVIFENVLGTRDLKGRLTGPDGVGQLFSTANSSILGSIFYIRGDEQFHGGSMFTATDETGSYGLTSNNLLRHLVSYVPSTYSSVRPFSLSGSGGTNNRMIDSVGIGQTSSSISGSWTQSNVRSVTNAASADIWNTVPGVCKRYVNGVLTNEGLWPWPMNQRIISALQQAGYTGNDVVDVTATMEQIFGPIPAECRN